MDSRFHVRGDEAAGFWVANTDGVRVTPIYRRVQDAKAAATRRENAKGSKRPCITCRKPFDSEGPHNRMCPLCRPRSQEASVSLPTGRASRRAGF